MNIYPYFFSNIPKNIININDQIILTILSNSVKLQIKSINLNLFKINMKNYDRLIILHFC